MSESKDYNVIVIGPGGIKGYLFLGTLYYLEKTRKLENIDTYIGVSVGGLIIVLYEIGFTVKEILQIALEKGQLVDIDNLNLLEIYKNFREKMGFLDIDKFRQRLRQSIIDKIGYVPTLKQLHDRTKRKVILLSYNMTKEVKVVYSYQNKPDLDIVEAILLSAAIPLALTKIELDGDLHIDGAFADPYPVLLEDNGSNRILGISIRTSKTDSRYSNPIFYLHDVFHCFFHVSFERNREMASDKVDHLQLYTSIIDTIGATVTIDEKMQMFLDGVRDAKLFFSDTNFTI